MYNKLTPEEENIILRKGTEKPFTGKYNDFSEKGVYICKRCDAPLYRSEDKFESPCGWPSFDDEISDAVKRQPDTDKKRTEIICARCGAHLGHIFAGEHLTDKNIRHCVNSLSMRFVSSAKFAKRKHAYFAGGCFWGMEYLFEQKPGVYFAESGYMGGNLDNPSYKEVCNGRTGHYETVKVTYDPERIDYEELVKYFFEIHDFAQTDGQGPDKGQQYLSVIFYAEDETKIVAQKIMEILNKKRFKVTTQLLHAGKFWKAEDYHQNYYTKTGKQPYCHRYRKIFEN